VIEFTAFGNPVPKARPRLGQRQANGKRKAYTPKRTKNWERTVADYCGIATRGDGFECDVSVWIVFHREDRVNVDLDNLIKSVLDGMNGIAYDDDKQVVEIHAWLKYDKENPRVEVKIKPV